ncbi:hypothetical protein [Methanobrevibacter sp.]
MPNTETLDLEPVITGLCYRKTETLTETEIRQAITEAMLNFGVEYVTTLPTGDNIKQKVYILPDTSGTAGNFGDIYIYDRTNTNWVHIDALKFNIDNYLLISDIVNDLTSTNVNKALSANQGRVLKALVDGKSASSHGHGNISNTGTLNSDISTVNKVVVTDSSNNVKTINKLPSDKVTHQDITGKLDKAQGTSNNGKFLKVGADGNVALETVTIPPAYTHPSYTAQSNGLYKITVDNLGHISNVIAVAKADITALGIPGEDTVYTHPSTHPTSMIIDSNAYANLGTRADASQEAINTAINSKIGNVIAIIAGTGN